MSTKKPSFRFVIFEHRPMIYEYEVNARSKKEALEKFKSLSNYFEIGLSPGYGITKFEVIKKGEARSLCAACSESFSPENVADYLCDSCVTKGIV